MVDTRVYCRSEQPRLREFGAVIVTCINREYAKKLVIQLPRQKHPYHFHKQKEETFQLLDGDMSQVREREQLMQLDTRKLASDILTKPVNASVLFNAVNHGVVTRQGSSDRVMPLRTMPVIVSSIVSGMTIAVSSAVMTSADVPVGSPARNQYAGDTRTKNAAANRNGPTSGSSPTRSARPP